MYCLCFGILLNECYVNTLGLYWFFDVVNFNYKKWKSLDLLEVMYNKYYLGDECYVSTLGLYWFFGVINFNYKKLKSLMHFILDVEKWKFLKTEICIM